MFPLSCFRTTFLRLICLVCLAAMHAPATQPLWAQKFEPNYDETKIPDFELPPVLDGMTEKATDFELAWSARRARLIGMFYEQMYGRMPESPFEVSCEKFESGDSVGGKALRQQFHVTISTLAGEHSFDLLLFTPKNSTGPVPCFLGLSFYGNHTVSVDEQITISTAWNRPSKEHGVEDNRATAAGRGTSQSRWAIEQIVDAGCGVATAYCGDIDPDFDDQFQNGVHRLFPDFVPSEEHPDRWGTISAWAWGLSRVLDCLQEIPEVAGDKVVVIGHSRLGKTALWAGATDTRFAGAISNNSGCGGAALSRRGIGETVGRINSSFPHWFCGNFKQYNLNEHSLPIDQHQLIALMAPRPVYVASATEDQWADPKGEFLAAKIGGQIYSRFGYKALALDEIPEPNTASVGRVSYHLREGKHDITDWDWRNYIEFIGQLK